MRVLDVTKYWGSFLVLGTLAGLFGGLDARAQITTPLTLDFEVNYVIDPSARDVTFTGTGTIAPFGSAVLNGSSTSTMSSSATTLTFTIASGDSFKATDLHGTKNGSQCAVNAPIGRHEAPTHSLMRPRALSGPSPKAVLRNK